MGEAARKRSHIPKWMLRWPQFMAGMDEEDVDELGDELLRIRAECGHEPGEYLDASIVEARKRGTVVHRHLHKRLEWDDAKCGVHHRRSQMRRFHLNFVLVERVQDDGRAPPKPAIITLLEDGAPSRAVGDRQDFEMSPEHNNSLVCRGIAKIEGYLPWIRGEVPYLEKAIVRAVKEWLGR